MVFGRRVLVSAAEESFLLDAGLLDVGLIVGTRSNGRNETAQRGHGGPAQLGHPASEIREGEGPRCRGEGRKRPGLRMRVLVIERVPTVESRVVAPQTARSCIGQTSAAPMPYLIVQGGIGRGQIR